MIESYADKETAKIARGETSRKLPRESQETARERMRMLRRIVKIQELWGFPSLRVKRVGKGWSLRINEQWRLTFFWNEGTSTASELRIEDYH